MSPDIHKKAEEKERQEEIAEVFFFLWVVDSNKTSPLLDDILSYTRTETLIDARKTLKKTIQEQGLTFVAETIEKPLVPIIKKMKVSGVKIDVERLRLLSKKYHAELESLGKQIWKIVGQEFNIASPKQLGEMLFVKMGLKPKNQKKTASGGFSTKESELEKLRDEHPIAGLVLEYRELAKLLGTYIDTIPTQVAEDGDRKS